VKGVKGGISSEGAKASVGRSLTAPFPPKSAKHNKGTLSCKNPFGFLIVGKQCIRASEREGVKGCSMDNNILFLRIKFY